MTSISGEPAAGRGTASLLQAKNGGPCWRYAPARTTPRVFALGDCPWSPAVNGRHRGPNPAASNSISQNDFPGFVYTNLTVSYQATKNLQGFAVIDNVFDRYPPTYALNAFSTNAADYYDTVGRRYTVGVRVKF